MRRSSALRAAIPCSALVLGLVVAAATSCLGATNGDVASEAGPDGSVAGDEETGADGGYGDELGLPPPPTPDVCGSVTCPVGQHCIHACCAQYKRTCAPTTPVDGGDGGCPAGHHPCGTDVGSCEPDICDAGQPPRCSAQPPNGSGGCNFQGSENIVLECHCN